MAIAINRKQTEFILEEDRQVDASLQTKFLIKPLSAKQYAMIQDKMKFIGEKDNVHIDNVGSYVLDVLKCGLVGWQNFKDADGQDVKFNSKNIDDNIDFLSVPMRYEISGAIIELSVLGEAKEKN